MNYSAIEYARGKITKYETDCQELVKKLNLSLLSLANTTLNSKEKRKFWEGLLEYNKNIIGKSEEMLNKLNGIRFSNEEAILQEERDYLAQKYDLLIDELKRTKEIILRQMKEEATSLTPFREKKELKIGYCYFCGISIDAGFPYKLGQEEKKVLEIELVEGAEFCSQECLLNYCKEYKNWKKLHHEEEKKNKEKIEQDKKIITEIQGKIENLIIKINRLEKKERELELSEGFNRQAKKKGFLHRLGRKLGLVKEESLHQVWEKTKKQKENLKNKLEELHNELQKAMIIFSVDSQTEQQRQKKLAKKVE